jgi:hypothetical protein
MSIPGETGLQRKSGTVASKPDISKRWAGGWGGGGGGGPGRGGVGGGTVEEGREMCDKGQDLKARRQWGVRFIEIRRDQVPKRSCGNGEKVEHCGISTTRPASTLLLMKK